MYQNQYPSHKHDSFFLRVAIAFNQHYNGFLAFRREDRALLCVRAMDLHPRRQI